MRSILKTIIQHYRVDRREIAFIKFIFEGYDGIAGMRTINPAKGIIELRIAPGPEEPVDRILQDLKREILMRRLATEPPEAG